MFATFATIANTFCYVNYPSLTHTRLFCSDSFRIHFVYICNVEAKKTNTQKLSQLCYHSNENFLWNCDSRNAQSYCIECEVSLYACVCKVPNPGTSFSPPRIFIIMNALMFTAILCSPHSRRRRERSTTNECAIIKR